MTRIMTASTILGLTGLLVAMFAALSGALPLLIAIGFSMLALGFTGAVIGAAASLGRAWEAAR
ncbi:MULTISPECIES: hypothetical protein [unclassified Ruegeria]|uniref:hypothetical protein n=1 Tax=unclassified Ruegeria TaxID=2625375 RepID=UPI0014890EEE|nr:MULTISPECIES: hypothetical protein [unclassified Ruegeria]